MKVLTRLLIKLLYSEFVVHAAPQADRLYADAVQAFREKASNLVEKREGSIHQDTDESATKDILHQL